MYSYCLYWFAAAGAGSLHAKLEGHNGITFACLAALFLYYWPVTYLYQKRWDIAVEEEVGRLLPKYGKVGVAVSREEEAQMTRRQRRLATYYYLALQGRASRRPRRLRPRSSWQASLRPRSSWSWPGRDPLPLPCFRFWTVFTKPYLPSFRCRPQAAAWHARPQ